MQELAQVAVEALLRGFVAPAPLIYKIGCEAQVPKTASDSRSTSSPLLPDILSPNLDVVLVGTAKSVASVRAGHYYANPRNQFWDLLLATGLTGGQEVGSEEDRSLPGFGIGLTDLVSRRAASSDDLLEAGDFDLTGFLAKMELLHPSAIGFNGATGVKRLARHLGRPPPRPGPLDWAIGDSPAYLLPSSSSRNARGGFAAKREAWVAFGDWVRSVVRQPG